MEYGEKIVANVYWKGRYPKAVYRFRIDPVPFIHNYKRWFGCYYKRPKTTQERRLSYAYEGYVRGKRRDNNLPNAWDDYPRSDLRVRRCWKRSKVKKQWMKNMRV